jgi:3-oxoacyl-[acyl-carrier protein] reductase
VAGSVALITGAASGMGHATATLFAAEGAKVAGLDNQAELLAQTVSAIEAAGGTALGLPTDLSDPQAIGAAVDAAAERFGGIDIVVNNAGVLGFMAMDDPGYDTLWDRVLMVNLTAVQRVVRAALPHLRKSAAPRVVNIASTEALGATPLNTAYAASKTGVAGLTRAMALDLGKSGITVNCVCPGFISTPMTGFMDEEQRAKFVHGRTALRRAGEPEEVAQMTLSLCLPAASYVTGAIIPVDGGLVARNA